ncbi:polysaccharide export protein [Pacificimonas flava]|uniref:Polysaccharide export protein n=2 Tax=Pacificimonas TaxID=1960290 RepID=A0A219B8B7_9SPHN|nr:MULTISPECIES: XrtA/PEP-CTERM system exopolysaccharide export protein [Pacificimonas]MBZ6380004.1 polysaccharide export protein [Pacificimonas aurantium]OWV34521.1 polysaccharide export protein [Pacificimonas flava]
MREAWAAAAKAGRRNGLLVAALAVAVSACSSTSGLPELPPARQAFADEVALEEEYRIGPLDGLQVFVWRNPELSTNVVVRPDGRITIPLIDDLEVTGKTPAQLADIIEEELAVYIADPIVQVIVSGFNGPLSRQVRIVGEATQPAAIPYRNKMTLLDVMVAVGGLSPIAAGDSARLVRTDPDTGAQQEYALRIESLLQDGDISANVAIEPGDVIIIPESFL